MKLTRGPQTRRALGLLGLCMLTAALLIVPAAPASQPGGQTMFSDRSFPAIAMPNQDLELSFVVQGMIDFVAIKPEEHVTKGQLLAQLDDRVQRQQTRLAELAVENTSAIDTALERLERAKRDLDRMEEAQRRGGVNEREADDARTTHALSVIEVRGQRMAQQENRAILARERARLEQMRITSPIDGIVADVVREAGESVDELQAVIRVVDIDPLWVDVAIPASAAGHVQVDDPVDVRWRDLPEQPPASGRVLFVSSVGDPASSTIRIRVEVPNPTEIPGGQHVAIRFPPAAEDPTRTK
jgi:RND family efflux transporter MFP subunit